MFVEQRPLWLDKITDNKLLQYASALESETPLDSLFNNMV